MFSKHLDDLRSVIAESDSESISDDGSPALLASYAEKSMEEAIPSLPSASGPSTPSTSHAILQNDPLVRVSCHDSPPTTSSAIPKVECPLCFKCCPLNEVESHADGCPGAFGLVEENSGEGFNEYANDFEMSGEEKDQMGNTSLVKCINDLKDDQIWRWSGSLYEGR